MGYMFSTLVPRDPANVNVRTTMFNDIKMIVFVIALFRSWSVLQVILNGIRISDLFALRPTEPLEC